MDGRNFLDIDHDKVRLQRCDGVNIIIESWSYLVKALDDFPDKKVVLLSDITWPEDATKNQETINLAMYIQNHC